MIILPSMSGTTSRVFPPHLNSITPAQRANASQNIPASLLTVAATAQAVPLAAGLASAAYAGIKAVGAKVSAPHVGLVTSAAELASVLPRFAGGANASGEHAKRIRELEREQKTFTDHASAALQHLSAPTKANWDTKYLGKVTRGRKGRRTRNRKPYSKNTDTHSKISHFHAAPSSSAPTDITSRRAVREYLEQKNDPLPPPPPRKPVKYAEGVFPFGEGQLGGDSHERIRELVPHDSNTPLYKRQYLPHLGGQDKTTRWIQGMLGPGLRKHLGGTDAAIADALLSKKRTYTGLFGQPNQFKEVRTSNVHAGHLRRELKQEIRDALSHSTSPEPRRHAIAVEDHSMLVDDNSAALRLASHASNVISPGDSKKESIPATG